jgi:asparagine synthase (glutamine-hydrolysing)
MCGINGVFHYRGGAADLDLVERQRDVMTHRGPDSCGLWSDGDVAFGHRRLAIVDLSPGGHQPMPNEDESVWVTFNGEIYGWPSLRSTLAAHGHRFRGNSDTEALLHLYEEHGVDMMPHVRGMYAFGLFDRRARRLMLGRDRFGIKPLYYHDDGRRLVFASELKALMLDPSVPREVDERAIAEYLSMGYVPAPGSIWKNVRKLPPAHALVCDPNGVRLVRFWALPNRPNPGQSVDFYRERLIGLLRDSVRVRLLSDVPLGAFLSGGIDSSAVVAMMQKVVPERVKTFTIGFEESEFSELEPARAVAKHLGTDHHEMIVRPRALEVLPRLIWQMDEPCADASIIPTHYVSEMARQLVTVALSGDGGDETFGGYTTYSWALQYSMIDRLPGRVRRLLALPGRFLHPDHPLGRKLTRLPMSSVDRHLNVQGTLQPREMVAMLGPDLRRVVAGYDPLAQLREIHARAAEGLGNIPALLQLDAQTYMVDDVLAKVDRMSMLHSLEVREAFLDYPLQEFAASIPFEYKLRGGAGKWILRDAMREFLPPEILERGKQGFGVPLASWFGGGFDRMAKEILLDPIARRRGWFDTSAVERQISDSASRDERRSQQTWTLICLELWAQTYLDRPREALSTPMTQWAGSGRL